MSIPHTPLVDDDDRSGADQRRGWKLALARASSTRPKWHRPRSFAGRPRMRHGGEAGRGPIRSSSSSARRPAGSRPCRGSSPVSRPTSRRRSSSPSISIRAARVTSARSCPATPACRSGSWRSRQPLEDGVIFVIPSNRLVEIVDGELRLRPARPGSVAPSVDLLLETAAAAFGPGAHRRHPDRHRHATGRRGPGTSSERAARSSSRTRPRRCSRRCRARSRRRWSTRRPTSIRSARSCATCWPSASRPRKATRAAHSRRCSTGSGSAAGSTSGPTRRRRSCAGCAGG